MQLFTLSSASVWGLLQQLLVQAMVVRNLAPRVASPLVVAVAGVLFGVIHMPHLALAASTAILGAIFTVISFVGATCGPWGSVTAGWVCSSIPGCSSEIPGSRSCPGCNTVVFFAGRCSCRSQLGLSFRWLM